MAARDLDHSDLASVTSRLGFDDRPVDPVILINEPDPVVQPFLSSSDGHEGGESVSAPADDRRWILRVGWATGAEPIVVHSCAPPETYIALAASVGNSAASRTAFAETSAQTAPWPSRCARRRLG
jgi:hypothetical protein